MDITARFCDLWGRDRDLPEITCSQSCQKAHNNNDGAAAKVNEKFKQKDMLPKPTQPQKDATTVGARVCIKRGLYTERGSV